VKTRLQRSLSDHLGFSSPAETDRETEDPPAERNGATGDSETAALGRAPVREPGDGPRAQAVDDRLDAGQALLERHRTRGACVRRDRWSSHLFFRLPRRPLVRGSAHELTLAALACRSLPALARCRPGAEATLWAALPHRVESVATGGRPSGGLAEAPLPLRDGDYSRVLSKFGEKVTGQLRGGEGLARGKRPFRDQRVERLVRAGTHDDIGEASPVCVGANGLLLADRNPDVADRPRRAREYDRYNDRPGVTNVACRSICTLLAAGGAAADGATTTSAATSAAMRG
jgi:hypothetical protein